MLQTLANPAVVDAAIVAAMIVVAGLILAVGAASVYRRWAQLDGHQGRRR